MLCDRVDRFRSLPSVRLLTSSVPSGSESEKICQHYSSVHLNFYLYICLFIYLTHIHKRSPISSSSSFLILPIDGARFQTGM